MDRRQHSFGYWDVTERRRSERLQVDAHLDDLQSEIEAGARALEKIHAHACRIDQLTATHVRRVGLNSDLIRQIASLRRSVKQQRGTLRELREEMRRLLSQLKSKTQRA